MNALEVATNARAAALAQGYTEVQATIVEQVAALDPLFLARLGVRAIVNVNEGKGVRFSTKNGRRVVNVDITLDEGQDLYDVEAWEVQGVNVSKIKSWTGQFFTDLPGCLREAVSV